MPRPATGASQGSNTVSLAIAASRQPKPPPAAGQAPGQELVQTYANITSGPAAKRSTDIGAGGERQADVIEMLSFIQSLGIDPVKESQLLWIAEEAFHAPLPAGWSEHTDKEGRVFFHNASQGTSAWQHPHDELYHEIVHYYRRIEAAGGFWVVEDELAELEEQIRQDLADWMELFDEHGEKFYYNRQTEESRFDDPRNAVYNSLYTRIKMVSKMREKLPLLAKAPRPEAPTQAELEAQKDQEEEEAKFLRYVLKIQATIRCLNAKRKMRAIKARQCLDRVPPELKGRLRLSIKSQAGGHKELVLSVTTPQRRRKAACMIQALVRGVQARMRFRPMLNHRRYLEEIAKVMQKQARVWLERRHARLAELKHRYNSVVNIQRWARGRQARKRVGKLQVERTRFRNMVGGLVRIQAMVRAFHARRRTRLMKIAQRTPSALLLQRQIRMFFAKREMVNHLMEAEPVQCFFETTTDKVISRWMPWTWRLGMPAQPNPEFDEIEVPEVEAAEGEAVTAAKGEAPEGEEAEQEEVVKKPMYGSIDLFQHVGLDTWQDEAASKLQKVARGKAGRRHLANTVGQATAATALILDVAAEELVRRERALRLIQRVARGWKVRQLEKPIQAKRGQWLGNRTSQIKRLQAYFARFVAQDGIAGAMVQQRQDFAATKIQSRARGIAARKHRLVLHEESVWPLKAWFEYKPTGRDSVQMSVQFFNNPCFSSYQYFKTYGTMDQLYDNLMDMETVVKDCATTYLDPAELAAALGLPPPDDGTQETRLDFATAFRRAAVTIEDMLSKSAEEEGGPIVLEDEVEVYAGKIQAAFGDFCGQVARAMVLAKVEEEMQAAEQSQELSEDFQTQRPLQQWDPEQMAWADVEGLTLNLVDESIEEAFTGAEDVETKLALLQQRLFQEQDNAAQMKTAAVESLTTHLAEYHHLGLRTESGGKNLDAQVEKLEQNLASLQETSAQDLDELSKLVPELREFLEKQAAGEAEGMDPLAAALEAAGPEPAASAAAEGAAEATEGAEGAAPQGEGDATAADVAPEEAFAGAAEVVAASGGAPALASPGGPILASPIGQGQPPASATPAAGASGALPMGAADALSLSQSLPRPPVETAEVECQTMDDLAFPLLGAGDIAEEPIGADDLHADELEEGEPSKKAKKKKKDKKKEKASRHGDAGDAIEGRAPSSRSGGSREEGAEERESSSGASDDEAEDGQAEEQGAEGIEKTLFMGSSETDDGYEDYNPGKKKGKNPFKKDCALKVLVEAEREGPGRPSPKRSHYAGKFINGRFEKTKNTSLDQLSEAEKQAILDDIALQRRKKVEELVRRQKKHTAKQQKQQKLEAQKLPGSLPQLKLSPQMVAEGGVAVPGRPGMLGKDKVLHRHVHHHMHYHEGQQDGEAGAMSPPPYYAAAAKRSASLGEMRGPATHAMMMRQPGKHTASAGQLKPLAGGWRGASSEEAETPRRQPRYYPAPADPAWPGATRHQSAWA